MDTTSSDSSSEARMGSRMPRERGAGPYRPRPAVTPEQWLSPRLGRTPAGVHQLLYTPFRSGLTLPSLTALCVTGFIEAGAEERLARWITPVRDAIARVRTIPLTKELIREAQLVDLEEDMVEAEYHCAPTAQNARRWVAWIDRCVTYLLKLRAALVAEHKLEDE